MTRKLLVAVCFFAMAASSLAAQRVVVLTLDDSIQPASLRYLQRGIDIARNGGAVLTIIELNTPGGLLTSLRQMTTAITASATPVAVYVTPSGGQAASAGFFLLMAADIAAMAPGTNTGAAHPVGPQGEDLQAKISEKIANDAAALARSLAQARGRPEEWAEKAVRESASFTASEALEKKLIDLIAIDRGDLLKQLDGREVKRFDGRVTTLKLDAPEIVPVVPNAADKLLSVIAHPNIAFLLFLAGIAGVGFELTHPGAIVPGVVGGLCLLLGLFALSVLPINYVGVLLMLLAIVFFVLEVKVTSYGLLTIAGLVSFVFGALMLIDTPIPALRVGLEVILPSALLIAGLVIFLLNRVLNVHRRPPLTGQEGLVGEEGRVVVALDPRGKVFVHGEYWDAVAPRPLALGERVRVVKVLGDRLEVEPVADSSTP
ncbi:MAG: nodulation protein NfeD [Acidobacteriota bacterium]